MTPTALATGLHLPVCEAWKRYPKTVGTWINTKPYGSGNALFSDDCYYLIQCSTSSRHNKVDKDIPITKRYIEGMSSGTGLTYGSEVFEWLSTVGNKPHCQIFGRKGYMKYIPDDWYFVEPDRPKISHEIAEKK